MDDVAKISKIQGSRFAPLSHYCSFAPFGGRWFGKSTLCDIAHLIREGVGGLGRSALGLSLLREKKEEYSP
jgi:hypothetical protein